jgi:hypothetical protein
MEKALQEKDNKTEADGRDTPGDGRASTWIINYS